jgi:hypothetical protein
MSDNMLAVFQFPIADTRLFVGDSPMRLLCAFRRLFSDGKVVSRIEVGFSQPARAPAMRHLSSEQYLPVVADIVSLSTR